MIVFVWIVIAVVTLMRAISIFNVPLVGDEAYYWEWSKRLAFGYVDHPPVVAWTIAAFSWLGSNPGFVRLGFVVSGIVATLAVAAAATEIARDRRAGAAAALALTLTPLLSLAFGMAQPDGPYLAFWCVSLWLAARAFRRNERWAWIALGFAMGGVLLSRFLGWALVFGVAAYALAPERRSAWRKGLTLSFAIAAACYAPFVLWNATHGWATFEFTFFGRHVPKAFSIKRVVDMYAVQAAAYSPGLWLGALICAVRPRDALLAWTSVPLIALLTVLGVFEPVEIHWVFGAYASLCVAIGIAYVALSPRARVIWATASAVPALVLLPAIFVATEVPGDIYQVIRSTGSVLRNTGPWEIYTTGQLAHNVKIIAGEHDAIVMTDGYGLSSVLDFDAGIPPVVIGYNWQGAESHEWITHIGGPRTALFVDKSSLVKLPPGPKHPLGEPGRPDFAAQLHRACAEVEPGPTLYYDAGMGVPPRPYYLTWCYGLTDRGLALLRAPGPWYTAPHIANL
ncbi:MAG: glycosyltransferase family 39 protein [Candidatus Eremiobacteraeota bacterium]|nr:glycosyltransferase family 39 protein [Candidatus Eremiobacteraeota bacterium]